MWAPSPALAAGKIYYGSRAGMQVTVVSIGGLDTAKAVIRTKHTREDAAAFCREYVGKVTPDCVREELQTPLNDEISADCVRGTFVDFRGNRYRFGGPNRDPDVTAKYRIVSLPSGEVADGSSASGYPVNIDIFRALCPSRAPGTE
ncbi:hypothetical protein [Methylorubrum extorquens]|uniref:Uncharacterized protein n=1 Tax=Methylorubrum extorquens (strain ATCC 14718 / DSM 1338 / JCM 2805 / NCIMB 9133 / AM1) TaxID=272630 RepID=C5B3H2_METEA|nr:hypothetical protein [Methylorubrum extorquens]ACS43004.1 conserved hypothetical protein [Methylorubrum extorquens AM1]MCP1545954.1 hypothetical protein [Methylorubrum extorquens]MCP1591904.1 hypothetical protein [Methylorubrum extorquens]